MDWDMNQELFAEEESEYTEYTEFTGDENSSTQNNYTYELDNDDDFDYEDDFQNVGVQSNAVLTTTVEGDKTDGSKRVSQTEEHDKHTHSDSFEVNGPLTLWDDDSTCNEFGNNFYSHSLPPSLISDCNTHGVVHVRLLRARNLPCPIGSSVGAGVSLPPYKGRVKSIREKGFMGKKLDHGVCVKWGMERRRTKQTLSATNDSDDDDLDDEINYDDEKNLLSMVNAWSGPNSPIPSIKIDLTFSPLGLGVFDFTMASVELSCSVLLQQPRVWRTRWCPMKVNAASSSQANYHHNHNDDPFIRIEAMFEPSLAPKATEEPLQPLAGTLNSSKTIPRKAMPVPPPPPHPAPLTLPPPPPPPRLPSTRTSQIENSTTNENNKHALTIVTNDSREDSNRSGSNAEYRLVPLKTGENHIAQDSTTFWGPQELTLMNAENTSQLSEEVSTVASKKTTASQMAARAAAALCTPHLLRSETYWAPARCAVCSKVLVGILKHGVGFRCEVCHIDCCSDCRLHVDLKVPCGSDLASDIVETSFRNKLSPSGLLSYIAPDETYEKERRSKMEDDGSIGGKKSSIISSKQSLSMTSFTNIAPSPKSMDGRGSNVFEGIGRCRFEIVTACLFKQNTNAWEEPINAQHELPPLRKGDYYVRISISDSDRSARTPTLQKTGGMPHFRSAEMRFPVSHYGVEFRIDVVDADTDSIVGSALLTTQGILQEQRDAYISKQGVSLLQFFKGPIPWMGTKKMKLKLRSGIKAGASADEFFSSDPSSSKGSSTGERKTSISGWVDIAVGIEEFYSRLYGSDPIECPNRPPDDLNLGNFTNYISRIKAILDDVKHAILLYKYMISWESPIWTATSLTIFVNACLKFNAEYVGLLPIFSFLVFLGYCAFQRNHGKIKGRYIQRQVEMMQKVEGNSVGYEVHRPFGSITLCVSKGRNLLSPEFGIAGNTSCNVIWDPLRFVDDKMKEQVAETDNSADNPFEMGNTPTIYTADPEWNKMEESAIAKRLNQLLPSPRNDFFESSSETTEGGIENEYLSFPILQPFRNLNFGVDGEKLGSWESSPGAIVLQVKFQDFFNNLPGFHHIMGEVVLPFSTIVKQRNLKGWFQVLDVGTTSLVTFEDDDLGEETIFCGSSLGPPRIYVDVSWDSPTKSSVFQPSDDEREISRAIQEELLRTSILSKENKVNLVDSSIGAVSKALGIGGTIQVVQNTLGSIIDIVEGGLNILNFTDPYKSSTIFISSLPVLFLFCIIPTRYIVLVAGLAQYGATFLARYGKLLGIVSDNKSGVDEDQFETKSNPFLTKMTNAIRSIPTNEDLRKTYFWESRQRGTERAKKLSFQKRESRLQKLWKAKWYSSMKILVQEGELDQSHQPTFHWQSGFGVVQGHRFIWWNSVDEFDDGELPSGKVILAGHAGLGGPSPIEMRELDKENELPLCLTIFGRGSAGQERVTMLLPEKRVRDNLENAVLFSASFKKD